MGRRCRQRGVVAEPELAAGQEGLQLGRVVGREGGVDRVDELAALAWQHPQGRGRIGGGARPNRQMS
jgi:hypothetical protein